MVFLVLGLFKEPASFNFDIGLACVPEKAGDIDGILSLSSMKPERRARGQNFWVGKGHCEGPTPVNWVMNADAGNGWQIDVPTVRVVETGKIGNTSWNVADLTSAGFAVRGSVGNSGSCGPRVFGQRVGVDARGSLGVRVDFEEMRMVPTESKQPIEGFQVAWGNDYPVPMTENGKGFVITFRQIDGKQRAASATGGYGWFAIEQNIDAKTIHVRVKAAAEAFATQ